MKERLTRKTDLINALKAQEPRLHKFFGVRRLGLFGSYAKGRGKKKSDLDLLVEFSKTPSLFQFIRLENDLTRLTGIHVDLVMKNSLKPAIGRHILSETIPIFPSQ